MSKLLTCVVPCYNSATYMRVCIDSLLACRAMKHGERVEIIIVNDGSTDDTAGIADDYAREYPGLVSVVHQENKGHGGAVNAGINRASGMYFKVIDSDDRAECAAFGDVLNTLAAFDQAKNAIDVLVTNFRVDKPDALYEMIIHYRHICPAGRVFTWDDIKRFRIGDSLTMHSMFYRTEVLRKSGVKLPENTFYVDNVLVYQPLPLVKRMYYLDVTFYNYFVGRSDQSVNEKVHVARQDQQIFVVRELIAMYRVQELQNVKLRKYMTNYLRIAASQTCAVLAMDGSEAAYAKKAAFWAYFEATDPATYRIIKNNWVGVLVQPDSRARLGVGLFIYRIVKTAINF